MKILILIAWILVGLYFGTGGITKMENYNLVQKTISQSDTVKVVYKDIIYTNKGALLQHLEQREIDSIYPWINVLPSYVSYIITACAFGLLGTLIHLFIQLALKRRPISELPVISLPVLGLLTGLVILGISLVAPAVLFNSDKDLKASGLMFICLFAGTFVDKLYNRLAVFFEKTVLRQETTNDKN